MTQKEYIEKNQERFLNELFEWLRIPSISADSAYSEDVKKAAHYVADKLKSAGCDLVKVEPTDGHPIVYAEKLVDPSLPTVLVYGHYDVQPSVPDDLWISPPFEPTVRDGKIYARGACDDKGQVYMHVKAFETMMNTNTLSCNVKFMIEGEEEVGSQNLGDYCKMNKDKLRCDIILISDTAMIDNETPSLDVGLRGLSYVEVEVTGPNIDLHSGVYGGAVANPANILCTMIASLHDENRHITIPGFYDHVLELSSSERAELAKTPFDLQAYKDELGIDDVLGEKGYSTIEQAGIRPTLDVNGIWSGYTGEGSKTVLPSKASAKISMRLVPNQNWKRITELFEDHLKAIAPRSVKVKVTPHHGGNPYLTPSGTKAYDSAVLAFRESFGKDPVPTRSGGSIPIVALFEDVLEVKSILMGFGLDTDAIHSPNEKFGIFNFMKGIETLPLFFKHFAA